jgi:hypothetical protein
MADSMNDREVTSTAKSATTPDKPAVTSGPATALGVANSAVGVAGLANKLINLSGFKLPMLNPLHKFASYTYNFTLAALDTASLNSPESTYLQNGLLPIVLKSAGGNPSNRIKTKFGAFDFYLDDLVINSLIGAQQGVGNTNATKIEFTITEPYSMGMFPVTLSQAAFKAGYDLGFRECIFLLKIEFKGADQNGIMTSLPKDSKYIPIRFTELKMSVTEGGATYRCKAIPAADIAHLQSNSRLITETTIVGSTVQEILQTGPRSLQSVINNRLRETALAAGLPTSDEIVIVFPPNSASTITSQPGEDEKDSKGKAADAPKVKLAEDSAIFEKLQVTRSTINNTLIQGTINAIGSADLEYGNNKTAKTPATSPGQVVVDGKVDQSTINVNPKISAYTIPQKSNIQNAITQVILTSKYVKDSLKNKPDDLGFRDWFRIETQVYHVDSDALNKKLGRKPQIIVYKIIPYKVHSTNMPIVGTKSSKFKQLVKQCAKVYNYIYTGKNTEVIKFNIDFDNKFNTALIPGGITTADAVASQANAESKENPTVIELPEGSATTDPTSFWNSMVNYFATNTSTDNRGSGGEETVEDRSVRVFQDAITYGGDFAKLEMDIMGDPYWLSGNGLGNYNSDPTDFFNVNKDGTVNFQNGEVDMLFTFKTPIDVNQGTGLYKMAGKRADQFTGLYKVQKVIHKFSGGQFTQSIEAKRRRILPEDTVDYSFDIAKTTPATPQGGRPRGGQ